MIEHIKKFGIPKSEFLNALINRFALNQRQIDACARYYILHWRGSHFKDMLKYGTITRENVTYNVVYKNIKPTDIHVDTPLMLSFRQPEKEYELQAFVLVTIAMNH